DLGRVVLPVELPGVHGILAGGGDRPGYGLEHPDPQGLALTSSYFGRRRVPATGWGRRGGDVAVRRLPGGGGGRIASPSRGAAGHDHENQDGQEGRRCSHSSAPHSSSFSVSRAGSGRLRTLQSHRTFLPC